MRCEEVHSKKLEFLDGVLDPVLKDAIEAHLNACAACRRDIAELRAVWDLLDHYPAAAGPAAAERLAAATLEGARRIRRREEAAARARRLLLAAAVVVAAVSLAWLFLRDGEPLRAPSEQDAVAVGVSAAAEAEAVDNLELLEDLDFLEAMEGDLDLVAEYERYLALGGEEAN